MFVTLVTKLLCKNEFSIYFDIYQSFLAKREALISVLAEVILGLRYKEFVFKPLVHLLMCRRLVT